MSGDSWYEVNYLENNQENNHPYTTHHNPPTHTHLIYVLLGGLFIPIYEPKMNSAVTSLFHHLLSKS